MRRNRSHIREMPCQTRPSLREDNENTATPRHITFDKEAGVKTSDSGNPNLKAAPNADLKSDPEHPTASYTRSGRIIRRPLRFRKDLTG